MRIKSIVWNKINTGDQLDFRPQIWLKITYPSVKKTMAIF